MLLWPVVLVLWGMMFAGLVVGAWVLALRYVDAPRASARARGRGDDAVIEELRHAESEVLRWVPASAAESLAQVLAEADRLAAAGVTARAWAEATANTSPGRERPIGIKRLETIIRSRKARPPLSPREARALRIAALMLLPIDTSAAKEAAEHPWLTPAQAERVAADHARECRTCGAKPPTLQRYACARCGTATPEGEANERAAAKALPP